MHIPSLKRWVLTLLQREATNGRRRVGIGQVVRTPRLTLIFRVSRQFEEKRNFVRAWGLHARSGLPSAHQVCWTLWIINLRFTLAPDQDND